MQMLKPTLFVEGFALPLKIKKNKIVVLFDKKYL